MATNMAFSQLMFITLHALAVSIILVDSNNTSSHLFGIGHNWTAGLCACIYIFVKNSAYFIKYI